ncbi:putative DNA repair protein [Scheffersomyces xylosifermentans]|uniref:putative DNA repair protein n=1 Tax=Scheffersomyces xylosifermentans TaxID=1304137 RepID=UPI00315D6537
MSRNTRSSSGVRGPNSALTEFLRNEGITDAFRERRERERRLGSEPLEEESPEEGASTSTAIEVSPAVTPRVTRRRAAATAVAEVEEVDEEVEEIRSAARKKRRAARRNRGGKRPGDSDSDDYNEDDDPDFSGDDEFGTDNVKKFGEEDTCVECGEIFNLTVYSRFLREKRGYVCENCNEIIKVREKKARANQLTARKRRKKVAQALLNKSEVRIPKLQDICIKKISDNIEDVDVLGDIGQINMIKLSKILSKNRSLNDATVSLFLSPDLKSLEFWDCSNVDSDSFNKIASYCPNLESLTLYMCGQLHNDNLKYYNSNLKNLSELSLNGPFLISEVMWQEFFDESGPKLKKFEVRNTHRFGNDSLISLLENTGSQLTSLKLSRLDGITSAAVYDLIPHYISPSTLTHLELSYPTKEDLISDELIINILAVSGESLISLNLDGCTNLTDTFLLDGIAKFCPNLTHLSIKNLDQITDKGFEKVFNEYSAVNSGGLISVNLTKVTGLGDKAIYSLLKHSAHTLVELSLNSINNITKEFLYQVFTDDHQQYKKKLLKSIKDGEEAEEGEPPLVYFNQIRLPLLTTLDLGFVRAVDDEILSLVGENCPKLSILEVYGDNRCTSRAQIRQGLMVIGRQNDEI